MCVCVCWWACPLLCMCVEGGGSCLLTVCQGQYTMSTFKRCYSQVAVTTWVCEGQLSFYRGLLLWQGVSVCVCSKTSANTRLLFGFTAGGLFCTERGCFSLPLSLPPFSLTLSLPCLSLPCLSPSPVSLPLSLCCFPAVHQ